MTTSAFEAAFTWLDSRPPLFQAIFRPVLLGAMRDAEFAQELATEVEHTDLVYLLELTWDVLKELRDGSRLGSVTPLPLDARTFERMAFHTTVYGAEEAFEYVQAAPSDERERLVAGLAVAFLRLRHAGTDVNILTVARLLRLALHDHAFIEHIFAQLPIEDFLPPEEATSHFSNAWPKSHDDPGGSSASTTHRMSGIILAPTHTFFVGKRVQLLLRVEERAPAQVVEGICTDISSTYIVVVANATDSTPEERRAGGRVLLFGMNSVIRVAVLSDDQGA